MMLNGWGVRAKLLGGFALVLLLLLINVGFSLSGMRSISSELDEILDNRYVKVDTANDLIKNTSEMGRHIRSIIISKKPEEQKKWMDRIAELRQSNDQLLGKLDTIVTSAEGRKLLADIAQARSQLQGKYQPLFSLVNESKNDEAAEYLKTEFVPVNNAFMDALEKLNAHEETAMLQAKQVAADTASRDRIFEVAFSLLALLIGIGVALFLSSSVSQGVTQAVKLANRIATGDLRSDGEKRIHADRDEVTQLLAALETMREQLSSALQQVQQHAVSVADSARELTSMSEQVAGSTAQQADSTAAAAASIEELTVSVNQVADNAVNASENARSAGGVAREGGQEIKHSAGLMQAMGSAVESTSQQMSQLAQEVQKVGSVVTVIREVADQTNLLALNAAIEAARAGESGRGFAVVADEVRKLAERTTQSAGEITRTIQAIQQNASGVQQSMEASREQSVQAAQSTFRTSEHILEVEQGTGHVLNAIANIDLALKEQKHASLSLARNMEQISQMAEGNSAAVEELASTSNQLMSLSQSLQTVVGSFRL